MHLSLSRLLSPLFRLHSWQPQFDGGAATEGNSVRRPSDGSSAGCIRWNLRDRGIITAAAASEQT